MSPFETDLSAVLGILREVAESQILPRFQNLAADGIGIKSGPEDLVTEADTAAEVALVEALGRLMPDAFFVGEEAVHTDPAILGGIAEARRAVIIDPIDGTWNYAHGIPLFGTMVAVTRAGETEAGVIHYPVTGDFVMAQRGAGAYHLGADGTRTPLKVSEAVPCERMSGFIPLALFPSQERTALAQRLPRFARATSMRCSAYEYRLLAQGIAAFSLNAKLMPWDHAAGQLIHTEAGGYSALVNGEPYRPSLIEGRLLLAPDEESWHAVRSALTGG